MSSFGLEKMVKEFETNHLFQGKNELRPSVRKVQIDADCSYFGETDENGEFQGKGVLRDRSKKRGIFWGMGKRRAPRVHDSYYV